MVHSPDHFFSLLRTAGLDRKTRGDRKWESNDSPEISNWTGTSDGKGMSYKCPCLDILLTSLGMVSGDNKKLG